MITYDVVKQIGMDAELALKGKSTDTKPTVSHDGYNIMNGSSFFEMDTQEVVFYDGSANDWFPKS